MVKIGKIVLGMFETNCYFVYDADTKKTIVFDPGKGGEELYEKLTQNGLSVSAICLTHGHFDHIMGVNELAKAAGVSVYALDLEDALCKDAALNSSASIRRPYTVTLDVLVTDGQELCIDGISMKVIATPGHTAGSCCYYFEEEKMLLTGDTLFAGSVGRTDLPTGNTAKLDESVHILLDMMADDVAVFPGHGPKTDIGTERVTNPFCS